MKTKLLALFSMIVLSMSFTACSDDDPQPAIEYKTEGYIKGKIVGVSADNSYTFNDDFNYTQYLTLGEIESYYEINDDGSFDISISRNDFSAGGSAYLNFELSNAADVTPNDSYLEINYFKELNDKVISFYMDSGDLDNTFSITDFTFDVTTGKVKGKYTLSGSDNSTDKNATVSGDFEVTAKKIVQ